MKNHLLSILTTWFVIMMFSVTSFAQTGPAGVGGHENDIEEGQPINAFWVRAGDLSLSDGDPVTKWDDVSGYNHSAVTGLPAADGIFFETDKVNGHPWVHFHGVNYLKVDDDDVLDGGTGLGIFVVAMRDSFKVEKYGGSSSLVAKRGHWNAWSHVPEISMDPSGLQHAYEIRWDKSRTDPSQDSAAITAFINGNLPDGGGSDVFPTRENTPDTETPYLISWAYSGIEDSYGAFVRINGLLTNRRYEGNPNPIVVGDVVNSNKDLWLGGSQYDPPGAFGDNPNKDDACPTCTETDLLEGAIAEVIIYKGPLSHTQVYLVENYLSLKYDLDIAEERYSKVFLEGENPVFVNDMIGIGNEFGDDQKHSLSKAGALTIEEFNESLDAEKEYLFVASDGNPYDMTAEGMGDLNAERWGRIWQFEEVGEVDASVSFDFIAAGLRMETAADYRVAYKENAEDDFTLLDATPTKILRSLKFDLEGENLKSGFYTLAYPTEASSVEEYNLSLSMLIYPNPAAESVELRFEEDIEGMIQIRVLDYTGRELSRMTDNKTSFAFTKQMNISELESGTYFIEIKINDYYAIKPFMKK